MRERQNCSNYSLLFFLKSLSKWDILLPTESLFSPQNIQDTKYAGLLPDF